MADQPSYIDYEAFLDPDFSPQSFANTLVLSTNNPSDTPLDLSTPLSRVLFDVQEIDTHIDTLTTKSALQLLTYTKKTTDAGSRIVEEVEGQVKTLTEGYKRLEREVIHRHETAEQTRIAAERLWQTVRLGSSVARALALGRQLELQMTEVGASTSKKEDHKALVRASEVLLTLRDFFTPSEPGGENEGLDRVKVVNTLRSDILRPSELKVVTRAQQIVREFSISTLTTTPTPGSSAISTTSTFAQAEDIKARTVSALNALYLLSPSPKDTYLPFEPTLLTSALQAYLSAMHTSSLSSLSRSLAALPSLDRTLTEISVRCQSIVALQTLLASIKPPSHPLLESSSRDYPNLLAPLLSALDTSSLPSHFWRSLASALSPKVHDLMARGGVSARTLRTNRDRVRDEITRCVARGAKPPAAVLSRPRGGGEGGAVTSKAVTGTDGYEREIAVMVGAVVGHLGR